MIYGQHHYGKGRNVREIITAGHRGGGHKHLCHKINVRRNEKKNIYCRIVTMTLIEMDTFVLYTVGMENTHTRTFYLVGFF